MWTSFEKWQGAGNDFIITWNALSDRELINEKMAQIAAKLCDRSGKGIGADGILNVFYKKNDPLSPLYLSIINSDGSYAVTCGNGLRVASLAVQRFRNENERQISARDQSFILKDDRVVKCHIDNYRFPSGFVKVDMGPTLLNRENDWHDAAIEEAQQIIGELNLRDQIGDIYSCNIGNNHLVILAKTATHQLACKIGPALQSIANLDGINIHIVSDESYDESHHAPLSLALQSSLHKATFLTHTWERGAGLTGACGSGASSVGMVLLELGKVERGRTMAIKMPGGYLYVSELQQEARPHALLSGFGQFVYSGTVFLDVF